MLERNLRWQRLASLCLASLLPANGANGAAPLLVSQERGVYAQASALEGSSSQEDDDADEASSFAAFSSVESPLAMTSDAAAAAVVSVSSSLSGGLLQGSGAADVSAATTQADASAEAPADSFFDVVFEAGASEAYQLSGVIDADTVGGIANASVELVDLGTGALLASFLVDTSGTEAFSEAGSLVQGVRYRVRASAVTHARVHSLPDSVLASASYQVVLAIPEPGSTLLLGAGLVFLFGLGRPRG